MTVTPNMEERLRRLKARLAVRPAPIEPVGRDGAVIEGPYRYLLWRTLTEEGGGTVLFVMLNPSIADEVEPDPTLTRCVGFARDLGYARVEVVNLYAVISSKPDLLRTTTVDPVGPRNDEAIRAAVARQPHRILVAWGTFDAPGIGERAAAVRELLGPHVWCLGVTKDGHPRHPLYLRKDTLMERYPPAPPAADAPTATPEPTDDDRTGDGAGSTLVGTPLPSTDAQDLVDSFRPLVDPVVARHAGGGERARVVEGAPAPERGPGPVRGPSSPGVDLEGPGLGLGADAPGPGADARPGEGAGTDPSGGGVVGRRSLGAAHRVSIVRTPIGPPCAVQLDDGRVVHGFRVPDDHPRGTSDVVFVGEPVRHIVTAKRNGRVVHDEEGRATLYVDAGSGKAIRGADVGEETVDHVEPAEPPPLRSMRRA